MSEVKQQQLNKPVFLIGLTILFILLIEFIPSGLNIFGYKTKPVDMFMDIKPDSLIDYGMNSLEQNIDEQKVMLAQNDNITTSKYTSALTLDLIKTAFGKPSAERNENETLAPELKKLGASVGLSGNLSQMSYFYNALKKSGSSQVRVAHYGDSEIEGDLITSDLRNDLQKKYGGEGVGFLSITAQDINFRTTTKHSFSDDWKTVSVLTRNSENIPLGVNGFVAIPQGNSWVKYEATGANEASKSFSIVKLYYSNAKSSSIKYSFDNGKEETTRLVAGDDIHELVLKSNGSAKSIKITATMANQAYFYGVSLESGNGVYVDNFPWRGNSGIAFRDLDTKTLKQFNKYLDYDLLILSFGGNMIGNSSSDFSWYENQMIKIVENLKEVYPNTSIILVSVGDKSVKRGSRFITDPSVPSLLAAQKKIAEKTGVAFWNLFEAMGGKNSMAEWVDANPPLAFKDYTHVTLQGAGKIADLLVESIQNGK